MPFYGFKAKLAAAFPGILAAGGDYRDVAKEVGCSANYAHTAGKEMGFIPTSLFRHRRFTKLTIESHAALMKMIADGARGVDIAKHFGISPAMVVHYKNGKAGAGRKPCIA